MSATLVLLLPLLSAALIVLALKKSAALSVLVSAGSALACLVLSIGLLFGSGTDGKVLLFDWISIGTFNLPITLDVNGLSKSMLFIVTFVGALVHLFSIGYMKDDAGKARFFAGLSLFMFSMTGIVLASNLPMMFIFWELVGVSSYILIGHWYEKNSAADAAKKAFLMNRIGDFGFMIGILLVWSLTGLTDFAELEAWFAQNAGSVAPGLLTAAALCIFCGAVGKSAQFPLHVWLPDAMEGPTPVSALIHAATMVAAGVYMMVKVAFLVAASATAACWISWIGGITALMAALMATQQNDIKRILAYSTLSQLGYMVMAVGLNASQAGYFHLYTHAFFKALLFLGSGAVIYACHHEQDIWKMGGLAKKMRITAATFAAGTAALVAVPFTSGYFSKEAILTAAKEQSVMLFLIAAFTAFLTAFYMTRLFVVAFLGKPRAHGADHAHEAPAVMLVPLILLAIPSLIAGFGFVADKLVPHEIIHHGEGHGMLAMLFSIPGIVSLVALGAGLFFGYTVYVGKDSDPIRIPLFANKFYFDEFYQKLVKLFQDAVAAVLNVFDQLFIDGVAVRGSGLAAGGLGQAFRRLQVGNLQGYAFLFGLGVLLLLFLALA